MKLIEMNPHWLGFGGDGVTTADGSFVPRRERVGIEFDCPCGCKHPVAVTFANPEDGLGPISPAPYPSWHRVGDTFETLTLSPSIQREIPARCWHGYVTNGEITTC